MNISGSNVRLRYTGLMLFLSRLFSTFTGIVFVLLITRKLPIEQYGLWRMISSYLAYTFVFADVFSYWLPRTMARGVNTSKTGLTLSLILGSAATLLYIIITFFFSTAFDQPLLILLIAAPQVILFYLQFALESISSGYAPQIIGYAKVVFELLKIGLAWFLVLYYRAELSGAILAVMVAQAVSIVFLVTLNFKIITGSRLDFDIAKSWLRHSWLPIFNASVGMVMGLDVLLLRRLSGSEQPIAYYGAALTVAAVVANANAVVSGLYPRLLDRVSKSEVEVTMKLMYLLGIPMAIFIFFYAEPISAVYGLKYLIAIDTIRAASVASLISMFSALLDTIMLGAERKDAAGLTFRDLLSSMLFKLPILNCSISVLHLAIVYTLQVNVNSYSEASFRWIIATIVSTIIAIVVKIIILRKSYRITISTNTVIFLLRYLAVSILVTALFFNVLKVVPVERIMDLILSLFPPAAFVAASYFILLAAIDKEFREFIRLAFNEVRSSLKNM